ncbi:MAG: citrate/2-methylcitrate synthase [Firmicutes bacterium]|mgnify:CR=1 FL=1|nr:citrate/2-methylcitrate synthase [Bacillota bacterium]
MYVNSPHVFQLDSDKHKALLKEMALLVTKNNYIDPELYGKYDTKRGLRNIDGTGVLVGLTNIGDVHAYVIDDEGKRTPIEGQLFYRGIEIKELVKGFQQEKRHGFEETCYLLLFGTLPNSEKLKLFQETLSEKRLLPNGFTEDMILKAPSSDIMNKLARSVLASYSYDPNPDDNSVDNVLRQLVELIARFPTMVAYGYQAKAHYYGNKSLYIHKPRKDLSLSENFLHMIRPDNYYSKLEAEVLDLSLVLHAEHGGGNNSAFVTHVVSSADTDTYSVIAAAVGALKGFKHGGANIKVMGMMQDIKEHVKDWKDEEAITNHLKKILNKEAFDKAGLIYGIGHAVYSLSDPRALLLKEKARELSREKGMDEEFQLYNLVEKLAPQVITAERKMYRPISFNVDFYSGLVYKMLDIPMVLYTPIFAIARIAGWAAHRLEEIISGGRIIRPAYKNVAARGNYIPLDKR